MHAHSHSLARSHTRTRTCTRIRTDGHASGASARPAARSTHGTASAAQPHVRCGHSRACLAAGHGGDHHKEEEGGAQACCIVVQRVAPCMTKWHEPAPAATQYAIWLQLLPHRAAPAGAHGRALLRCFALPPQRSLRARCGPLFLRPARVGTGARCACSRAYRCVGLQELMRTYASESLLGEERVKPGCSRNARTRVPAYPTPSVPERPTRRPTAASVGPATRVRSEHAQARVRCPHVHTVARALVHARRCVQVRAHRMQFRRRCSLPPSHRLPCCAQW